MDSDQSGEAFSYAVAISNTDDIFQFYRFRYIKAHIQKKCSLTVSVQLRAIRDIRDIQYCHSLFFFFLGLDT